TLGYPGSNRIQVISGRHFPLAVPIALVPVPLRPPQGDPAVFRGVGAVPAVGAPVEVGKGLSRMGAEVRITAFPWDPIGRGLLSQPGKPRVPDPLAQGRTIPFGPFMGVFMEYVYI